MFKFIRYPFFNFIILILAVILLIIFNLTGIFAPIKNLAIFIISPVEKSFSKIGNKIANTFYFFSQIKDLLKENKKLEEENRRLFAENVILKRIKHENELLRQQLNYKKHSQRKVLPAFVIGFDPYNLSQMVILNRGKKDGVRENMAVVVAGDILIGQIQKVTYYTSEILLITDSKAVVPAEIQSTKTTGIVKGEHGLGIIMEMIPRDEIVQIGDLVISSVFGSKFPPGLIIGKVEEIITLESELFQKVRIKSPVNFKKLESVYIILE